MDSLELDKVKGEVAQIGSVTENKEEVGYDYLIPVWGYLRYALPFNLKRHYYDFIYENVVLYLIVGFMWGYFHINFLYLIPIAIITLIAESVIYYHGLFDKIGLSKFGFEGTEAVKSYMMLQIHMFGFAIIGLIIGYMV